MAQDGAHERLPSMIGHPFSDFLGPPWEAKNHQKSTFSQKSRPRERFFIDFCCECRFPRFFDWFLVDFGWKINEKKLVFFKPSSQFFQHGDPHETLYFTIRKLLFRFLSFWFFFSKNWWKNDWKFHLPKKSKNDPRGTPKYIQNPEKMVAKSPKIPKNAKKVDFLRGRFFDDFLDGQKIEKRRHANHWLISSPGPGLHWGTIGGTIN